MIFYCSCGNNSGTDNGHVDAPGGGGTDGGADAPTDGEPAATSYTVSTGATACEDLTLGTVLEFTSSHVTQVRDLPFPFRMFGEPASRFIIAWPGHIYISEAPFVATVGDPREPPSTVIPNGWVAPFWDSRLEYLPNQRGEARVRLLGSGAAERFVMGYHDFTLRFPADTANPDVHLSFQVVLFRQSQALEFRYCDLDSGPNASQALKDRVLGVAAEVGLESSDGTRGVSYSFQRPLLSEGLSIQFTPAP